MKYLLLLLLTFPAAADFGYNPKTKMFCTTDKNADLDPCEYHDLAQQVVDIFTACSQDRERFEACIIKILAFLRGKGTHASVQLAKDMAKLWGYDGKNK